MADISKITLPNGNTYNIKDAEARSQIAALTGGDAVVFVGVSTTALTDGGNERPTVNGSQKTPATGQLFFYGSQEFIYGSDGTWHGLGDHSNLGALATKNKVKYDKTTSASYTSTNSTKSLTLSGSSSTVTISSSTSTSGNYTPAGTVSQPTFSGTEATIEVTGSASGTVSQPTFTGTKKTGLTVSAATSGTTTYTPKGTVSTPTISVKTAGSTNNTLKPVTAKTVVSALATAAPGATAPANAVTYYSVSDETLSLYQLGATTTSSVTLGSAVTVKTGDAVYQASQPSFTGTGVRLVLADYTPAGTISQPTFSNGSITGSATYTPVGTVSKPTFSGTKVQLSGTTTASGSVTLPTISLGHTSTEASYE